MLAHLPNALERYPGGKRWLPALYSHKLPSPSPRGRFYEPCAGMGAVSFHYLRRGHRVVIGDVNPSVAGLYANLQGEHEHVIDLLHGLALAHQGAGARAEEVYYLAREAMNATPPASPLASALFLYNRRTCFNGLQRENADGENNVPFGFPSPRRDLVQREKLGAVARALQRAIIRRGDFAETTEDAKRGDVTYFDPPYVGEDDFVSYSAGGFTKDDRKRLGVLLRDLDRRGVRWLLSDKDADDARAVYGLWNVCEVSVRRSGSASPKGRGAACEILVCNF